MTAAAAIGWAAAAAAAVGRIVSAAPSTTEILFAAGAGPRVVAVTRFCDWPPEAKALPKVGGFLDLSYEAVLAARPDLVVGARNAANREVVERLAAAGLAVEFPPAETVAETLAAVRAVSARAGAAARGEALAAEMARGLARLSGLLAGAAPVRAVLVYGHRPVVVAGAGTFADDLLRLARADNPAATPGGGVRYPTVPIEALAAWAPQVVLDVTMTGTEGAGESGGASPLAAFPSIPAVRDGRLVSLDAAFAMRPGPRLPLAAWTLAHAVHPTLVPAPAAAAADGP